MSFISYAQNYEDVMLWRALKQVQGGFYIDVGAAWPVEHSVTKAFYDRGWRGINIEPNPQLNQQLQNERRRDISLRVAVSDHEGVLPMSFVYDTGLSTLDEAIAEQHQSSGWEADRQDVRVTTLAAIWQQHVPPEQSVHFLKVDVEGFEESALRGNDWTRNRPWIVVVEATLPMSQVESHEAWEPILRDANYKLVYVDGLNRYYLAAEHTELMSAFQYPPNVFDGFVLSSQVQAEARANSAEAAAEQAQFRSSEAEAATLQAQARSSEAEARAASAETAAQQAQAAAHNAWLQYQAVIHSTSWRLTKPLRLVAVAAQWLACGGKAWLTLAPGSRPRRILRRMILASMAQVQQRPRLKAMVLREVNRFPRLKQRLQLTRNSLLSTAVPVSEALPAQLSDLSPHARRIYVRLKAAIEKNSKGIC